MHLQHAEGKGKAIWHTSKDKEKLNQLEKQWKYLCGLLMSLDYFLQKNRINQSIYLISDSSYQKKN